MGFFDKVTGKEKRIRLINQEETAGLKDKQKSVKEELVFRHGGVRSVLQGEFVELRTKQREERTLLASRIMEFRQSQDRDVKRKSSLSQTFEKSAQKSDGNRGVDKKETRRTSRRNRTRDRSRDL